ncbi:MAG: hypothetical protein OHK0046_16490 [Anaerolineae bacterium]
MEDKHILAALADDIRTQAESGAERLDMNRLMTLAPWSRRHMERMFRACYLTSPARYFRDCQAVIAGRLLAEGHDVLSASAQSGFASPGRLHDAMVARYGLTPGEVRAKGQGVKMYFGFFETQIGFVLIAATERGLSTLRLCGAHLTEDAASEKVAEFTQEYCHADLEELPEKVQVYADQLVAFLDARTSSFCPPLDILEGTTFQREVWAELQKVKPGETITYSELAERIGRPKAVRAVAQACGSNNLAVAIPCHRAIRKNGELAGYRWGIEWKQHLLRIETEIRERAVPGTNMPGRAVSGQAAVERVS